jgi:type VI secretion system protein ImpG
VLPFVRRSFLGYRLLQEYFAFPRKFLFVDLAGLDVLRTGGFGAEAEVYFLFSAFERTKRTERFEADVHADTFRLGCTPAVNLFEAQSEPCKLDQRASAYHLIADDYHLRATHIFSVDSVAIRSRSESIPVEPLYSLDRTGMGQKAYWIARRRPSVSRRESDGVPETASSNGDYQGPSELWLSFIDLTGRVVQPDADSFDANVTCFNGDLPNRLPIGTGAGASQRSDFDLPGGGPFQAVVAISSPSPASQPPLGRAQLWRLISFLSLNYVSLTDAGLGPLKALLRLHNTHDSPAWSGRDHIDGIVGIQSAAQYARIAGEYGTGFARGLRVEVEFDEDRFEGASAYLFASVLERFFGLYNSINSFSVLAARSRQRRNLLREWAPRSGWRSPL